MDILKQESLTARRDFALSFIEKKDGVHLAIGERTISINSIWD